MLLASPWLLPTSFVALLASIGPVRADTYTMVKQYAGQTFFNDWVFYNNFDNLTNGDAIFVSQSVAQSSQLAFVDPNTNHAIIKVDNTSTVVFNDKRNTVRISSSDLYSVGSVWAADIVHAPFGCSVWPAWWSQNPAWPVGGEIDTYEGVNLQTINRMSLHTLPGCMQINPMQSSQMILSNDCSNLTNSNEGCVTQDPRPQAFGAAFAQNGGGVFVTEYAATGISIWFFPRGQVPSVFTSNSSALDTSTLGLPVANYPSSPGCDSNTFFGPQELIFDITLCGDFAGDAAIFNQTCSGNCYLDFVVGNGSVYANAFFEIASVSIFSKDGTNTIVSPNGGSGSSSGGGSTSGGGSSSGGGSTSGGSSGTQKGGSSARASMLWAGMGQDPIGILSATVLVIGVVMGVDFLISLA